MQKWRRLTTNEASRANLKSEKIILKSPPFLHRVYTNITFKRKGYNVSITFQTIQGSLSSLTDAPYFRFQNLLLSRHFF